MIDIPVGKAIAPVEANAERSCSGCVLNGTDFCTAVFWCVSANRKDRKTVIFKLVDYPGEEK